MLLAIDELSRLQCDDTVAVSPDIVKPAGQMYPSTQRFTMDLLVVRHCGGSRPSDVNRINTAAACADQMLQADAPGRLVLPVPESDSDIVTRVQPASSNISDVTAHIYVCLIAASADRVMSRSASRFPLTYRPIPAV